MIMCMELLQWATDLDTDVFLFFNGMHNTYFDHFMYIYTGKWIWIPLYISIFYVLLRNLHGKIFLCCLAVMALGIVFADQICSQLIRPCVERMRPSNLDNPLSDFVHIVNNNRAGRYGFPSCHAANTFMLAFFVCLLFRNRWLTSFMMAWALLTCYSRVYLGVHYPGDLLVGALIGMAVAWPMYRLFAWLLGYQHPCSLKTGTLPIWIGGLTILVIAFYSIFRL